MTVEQLDKLIEDYFDGKISKEEFSDQVFKEGLNIEVVVKTKVDEEDLREQPLSKKTA